MSANAPQAEHTTEMAVSERHKLRKSLTYFDMVFFTVCVGLDILGHVSGYGAQTFTWIVVLIIFFLAPYALLMVELGSTFTQEGGPYEWMKLSLGAARRRNRRGALLGDEPLLGRRIPLLHRDRRVEREPASDRRGRRPTSRCAGRARAGRRRSRRSRG